MLTDERRILTYTTTYAAYMFCSGIVGAAIAATFVAAPFVSASLLSGENSAMRLDEEIQFKPEERNTVLDGFLKGMVGGAAAIVGLEFFIQKRFERYKKRPLLESNDNRDEFPKASSSEIRPSYPQGQPTDKTWRVLLVPERYDAETLQNPDFKRGVERYQAFLQAHFPKQLVAVGIAWPNGFFDTTCPHEKFSRTVAGNHPSLRDADAVVTLWNTEDKRLWEHADPFNAAAIIRGPTPQGKSDLKMLLALLHETVHLIPAREWLNIDDSYKHEFVLYHKNKIDAFSHTGFLPDLPKEDWRDTYVTDAVRHYQVPLVPYSQDGRKYLAIGERTHIMDNPHVLSEPMQQIAFGLTGGKMIPAYLEYIIKQNLTDWLEKKERITPEEANAFREQYALGAQQVMNQSTLFYLGKIFGRS